MPEQNDTISVRSALPPTEDGGWPTALYEQDPAHKKQAWDEHGVDGEVYIYGDRTFVVARTAGVMAALKEGRLVEAGAAAPPPSEPVRQGAPRKAGE